MNRKKNIMLIDDNEIDNFIHKKIIGELIKNCIISEFCDPVDALNYLIQSHNIGFIPDMILIDVCMPKINGFQFLDEIKFLFRLQRHDIKIILVTSSSDPTDQAKAKQYELCTDYIVKPLTKAKLAPMFT